MKLYNSRKMSVNLTRRISAIFGGKPVKTATNVLNSLAFVGKTYRSAQ